MRLLRKDLREGIKGENILGIYFYLKGNFSSSLFSASLITVLAFFL